MVSVNKAKIAAGTIKPMAEPPKEAADLVKDGNVVATAAVSSGHSQRRHQSPQPRIKDFDVGVEVGIRRGGGGAGFNSRGSSRGSRRGGGSSNRGGSSSGSGVGGSSSETSSKTVGGLKVVFSTKSSASPSTAG